MKLPPSPAVVILASALISFAQPAAAQPKGSGTVSFKVNGETVTTDVWTFARFTNENDYNLTTNMHKDKRALLLNFAAPKKGEPITLGPIGSGSYGTYFPKFGDHSAGNYSIESGTFTFTEFDTAAAVFSGTFTLVAKDPDGKSVEITDGVVTNGKIGRDQILQ